MRLVICNEENQKMQVGVDGKFYSGLDGSALPEDVHAVQWFGSSGWVEKKDPDTGLLVENEVIASIDEFQFAVNAWNAAYQAEKDAITAEQEAEENQSQPV